MLKLEIQKGRIKPGQKLLPEDSLAKDFDVSRATIRAALKILEHEHYLISKHGSGTFVSENVFFISNAINQLRSTSEMAKASGLNIQNRTISLILELADEKIQEYFSINEAEQIVKLERSGKYILGKNVESFEQKFADFCDTRYSVGISSGIVLVCLALLACGVVRD